MIWRLQVCFLLTLCQAILRKVDFEMNNFNRFVHFLEIDYGLELGGVIKVDLENRKASNDTYVLILSHEQWLLWRDTDMVRLTDDVPPLQAKGPLNAFLVSCWRGVLRDRLQGSFHVQEATGRDRYSVLFLSALEGSVDIHGQLSFDNPGNASLPVQDTDVPQALLVATGIYLVTALLISWRLWRGSSLHVLMFFVLSFRALVLLLKWLNLCLVLLDGRASSVAQISCSLFDKVQNIMELMMFLLISLGWKVLRAHLDISEIRFAAAISIISFYLGVFQVACTTPSTCSGYELSRYILHALCYLVVIVAMNFNLQKLLSAIQEASASVETGKLYRKLQAYHTFRWVFLLFITAPTFELFLKVTVIPWDHQWLFVLIQELRIYVIYVLLIYAYRPDPIALRVFELTERVSDEED